MEKNCVHRRGLGLFKLLLAILICGGFCLPAPGLLRAEEASKDNSVLLNWEELSQMNNLQEFTANLLGEAAEDYRAFRILVNYNRELLELVGAQVLYEDGVETATAEIQPGLVQCDARAREGFRLLKGRRELVSLRFRVKRAGDSQLLLQSSAFENLEGKAIPSTQTQTAQVQVSEALLNKKQLNIQIKASRYLPYYDQTQDGRPTRNRLASTTRNESLITAGLDTSGTTKASLTQGSSATLAVTLGQDAVPNEAPATSEGGQSPQRRKLVVVAGIGLVLVLFLIVLMLIFRRFDQPDSEDRRAAEDRPELEEGTAGADAAGTDDEQGAAASNTGEDEVDETN